MNATAIAIRDGQQTFDDLQIKALVQLGVKDASKADLAIFFHQCARTGLDPFTRQIYLIGRKTKINNQWTVKQTIQTGIDGFRLIARRAADRRKETLGYAETLWCGEDGNWREVWLSEEPPAAAKITVFRNGQPFPAVALMREYRQTTSTGEITSMWRSKPVLMLEKCAEALALRKAFPQDLSGLYTTDEMGDDEPGLMTPVKDGGSRQMRRQLATEPVEPEVEPDDEVVATIEPDENATETPDHQTALEAAWAADKAAE